MVRDTGDQTVAGIKTFSSFPITPSSSPTTDYQVANKAYVDTLASTAFSLSFTPLNITGLKLWLKASSIGQSDNTAVSAWNDSSPNGYNFAQVTGSEQPTYKTTGGSNNQPYVLFDGTDDNLLGASAISNIITANNYTVLIVFKADESDGTFFAEPVTDDDPGSGTRWKVGIRQPSSSNRLVLCTDSTCTTGTDINATGTAVWAIGELRNDNAVNGFVSVNNARMSETTVGTKTPNAVTQKAFLGVDGNGNYLSGSIAEVIVADTTLTQTERILLGLYLHSKYGI